VTARTDATVTARTDATVYRLGGEPFLTAVLGHAATQRQAEGIADVLLAADAASAGGGAPKEGVAEPG
jgi:CRP-like cAMP-binding protein